MASSNNDLDLDLDELGIIEAEFKANKGLSSDENKEQDETLTKTEAALDEGLLSNLIGKKDKKDKDKDKHKKDKSKDKKDKDKKSDKKDKDDKKEREKAEKKLRKEQEKQGHTLPAHQPCQPSSGTTPSYGWVAKDAHPTSGGNQPPGWVKKD